jgi:hypothetical protein
MIDSFEEEEMIAENLSTKELVVVVNLVAR